MKKNVVIIAGIALLAAALIAMPVSAGYGQGSNSAGCHGAQPGNTDCTAYSYGTGQCSGNLVQNSAQYCFKNPDCCLNDGTCQYNGTPYRYGGSGNCPCL